MKKLILAISILATAAAIVPANAMPRNVTTTGADVKMFATSPGATIRVGNQCWKQTDAGRGYGFWTACDNSYSYAVALVENETSIGKARGGRGSEDNGGGTEGGGGGDSGGGDGGGGGGGGG